jgi:hypothetical protein
MEKLKPSPSSLKTSVYNIKDSGSDGYFGQSQNNKPRLARGSSPLIVCLNVCFVVGVSMVAVAAVHYLAGISPQTTRYMLENNCFRGPSRLMAI